MNEEQHAPDLVMDAAAADLSTLLVLLLKGVIYREGEERLWGALLNWRNQVSGYVTVLGLELMLDEAEGYAFLRSRAETGENEPQVRVPRLVARRPLSFPVSLLLALLRKKLAEFDATGGDTRLVLTRDEIVELVRVFLPDSSNEARLIDQIDAHITKIVELGFLRRLKSSTGPLSYEVRRILKAFVDAQWLSDFDKRLGEYQMSLSGESESAPDDGQGIEQ